MGKPSSSAPTIGPAMPLPPSSTTFIAATLLASMKPSASFRKSSPISSVVMSPGCSAGGPGSPAMTMSRISPMPDSPESGSASRFTTLAPV
jgi:hypothetical protein